MALAEADSGSVYANQEDQLAYSARRALEADGSLDLVGTSLGVPHKVAYHMHRVVLLGRVPVHLIHLEIHLADQIDLEMGPRDHQGRQREDSHLAETDHVVESWGAVVVVVAAGLVARSPDEAGTAVPITNSRVSKQSPR